jgi:hypothetical protein
VIGCAGPAVEREGRRTGPVGRERRSPDRAGRSGWSWRSAGRQAGGGSEGGCSSAGRLVSP